MQKSIGIKKNIAVFISGTGSNLKKLIEYSFKKNSKFQIRLVISNKSKAIGLNHAKKNRIKSKIINYQDIKKAEKSILYELNKNNIDLVCLAGYMKILSKNFITRFKGKIINIHPSLLPKYKGLNTHQRVLDNNEKFSGCTIHYVSKKLDSGKIIAKKKVKIFKKDSLKKLEKRVLKEENKLYPLILEKLIRS